MEFNKYCRAYGLVLLGVVAAFPLIAVAQSSSSPSPYKYLDRSDGSRQIVPSSDTRAAAQGQQIWNSATSNTVDGSVRVGRNFSAPNPQGVQVPASVVGRLPPAAVAAAVGRVASLAVKSLTPIGLGLAIYDLAKELGFTFGKDSAGGETYTKSEPNDGYLYSYNGSTPAPVGTTCKKLVDDRNAASSSSGVWAKFVLTASRGVPFSDCRGDVVYMNYSSTDYNQTNAYFYGLEPSRFTGTSPVLPSSRQEFLDAVAAKSGWPALSKINDTVLTDPNPELQAPQEISVSGPVSSPGPKTTTVNSTKNATTTNTSTNNYSYAGDTITNTITNTTVTVDNSTGAISNSETTTSTPPPPTPPAPTPEKCPPGSVDLNCSTLDTPEGEIPKVTKDVTYQAESMFSGGACPADLVVPQRTTGRPVLLSYTPTCNALATYVKPIIIAIALFMAYLIILPGRND